MILRRLCKHAFGAVDGSAVRAKGRFHLFRGLAHELLESRALLASDDFATRVIDLVSPDAVGAPVESMAVRSEEVAVDVVDARVTTPKTRYVVADDPATHVTAGFSGVALLQLGGFLCTGSIHKAAMWE